MKNKDSIISPNMGEMTAIPGGIIEWVDSQTLTSMWEAFPMVRTDNPKHPQELPLLTDPIRIHPSNRSITLAHKPLSYEYQKQIMSFHSAYTPLLQFLQADAFHYEEIGNTCTTLFFANDTNELVGFCSTKCSSLKFKGEKIISLCPSVEVAALCIDDNYRYLGIGHAILNYTIQQVYTIQKIVGVQFITLFALPEAVAFYQKCDFCKLEKGIKVLYTSAHKYCIPMYFALPHYSSELASTQVKH
jgi:GNAT superfamily N-acetyltransferase